MEVIVSSLLGLIVLSLTLTWKRFYQYPKTPVQGVALGTSGLIALADLSTTAKRTALTGTASWLDIFVLAPGLHYQQKAESIGQTHTGGQPEVTNLHTGDTSKVTNSATIHYLQRVNRSDRTVIVDVGIASGRSRVRGQRGKIWRSETPPSSKISAFFFGIGPVLTVAAIVLDVLIKDWWALGLVLSLMFARLLNVLIVRERVKDTPAPSDNPNEHQCWWITVDDDHRICLRGLRHDLEAVTTGEWMRAKTDIEEYMEAMAKMIVYLSAVFSSNQSQTGDIVLMGLLGLSAVSLALSNTFATSFNMNGRTVTVTPGSNSPEAKKKDPKRDSNAPTISPTDPSSYASISDFEKDEAARVMETVYPFSADVNYV